MKGNLYILYAKDISQILKQSERAAERSIKNIRTDCGRTHGKFITLTEFCNYFKLTEADVLRALGKGDEG